MKRRRLTAAFLIILTWLAAASQVAADPVTFENMPGLLGDQDRVGAAPPVQVPGSLRVEIIDDGDVTGTIRECPFTPDGSPQVFSTGYPKAHLYVAAGVSLPFICCLLEICCPRRQVPEVRGCPNPPCLTGDVQIVPEPVTLTTLALGLGALQVVRMRRRGRK